MLFFFRRQFAFSDVDETVAHWLSASNSRAESWNADVELLQY